MGQRIHPYGCYIYENIITVAQYRLPEEGHDLLLGFDRIGGESRGKL